MRLGSILLVALAVATAAYAVTTALNPVKLALQHSDMPKNVEGTLLGPAHPEPKTADSLRFIGTGLKGADYSYTWPAGGTVNVPALGATDKEWHVTGDVFVAPSVAAANRLFADGKAAEHGFFADFGTDGAAQLRLPSYGDVQIALLGRDAGGPHAMVFVRKGSVVWELRVGHSPPKWTVKKAEVVNLLETYARKQKTRVGAG